MGAHYSKKEFHLDAMMRQNLIAVQFVRSCTSFGKRFAMKINRCPKCGRSPLIISEYNSDGDEYCGSKIMCCYCRLYTETCETMQKAIAKWNELTKGENK